MKTFNFYFLAFTLLAFTACKKQSQTSSFEKQLLGKWQYTGQGGGISGKYYPADPAVKTVLEFRNNQTFVRTENDQPVDQGPYELTSAKSIYTGKEDHAIRFDVTGVSPNRVCIISIRKDTLNIADNAYDGFTSSYIRIK
ncbi:hypothetical protein [Pedobacter heparinus]|uniref:hypothetical protein n=1 Tax=Pedobacter heparinus TaxID=984 RepID=UPI00292CE085|nr:hypothetical protein [Pedobacter heparinus]